MFPPSSVLLVCFTVLSRLDNGEFSLKVSFILIHTVVSQFLCSRSGADSTEVLNKLMLNEL